MSAECFPKSPSSSTRTAFNHRRLLKMTSAEGRDQPRVCVCVCVCHFRGTHALCDFFLIHMEVFVCLFVLARRSVFEPPCVRMHLD